MNRFQPPLSTYLWAAGPAAARCAPPNVIDGRYKVLQPQIWQDVYPEQFPHIPNPLPAELVAYLHLYPQRLHLPSVYGVCYLEGEPIVLLQDAPIDRSGHLLPSLVQSWSQASALRQVSWLWQLLQLWQPLEAQGVAASLLNPENLRVEGWCLRLRELSFSAAPATLQHLGQSWSNLAPSAQASIADQLAAIASELQRPETSFSLASKALNKLLLLQTAQQPLRCQIASATDSGPQHERNEDACYPLPADLASNGERQALAGNVAIVCDGIGGHEGGAEASQLAVQSLKLQAQALLSEIAREPELLSPEQVEDHLKAILRIANNLICSRNDAQGREARQRMATTVVMALNMAQAISLNDTEVGSSRELYLLHVGDSRAYWLTERYCQQLTVDDDVASREIRLGRSVPLQAQRRPDAGALTQALGTREAERLRPTIQRFILDEDGILLLCSDGLSDNQLLERSWLELVPDLLQGKLTLAAATDALVQLANQRNGHDNTTVVAAHYTLSAAPPAVLPPPELLPELPTEIPSLPEWRARRVLDSLARRQPEEQLSCDDAARSPESEPLPPPEPEAKPEPSEPPDFAPSRYEPPASDLGESNGSPPPPAEPPPPPAPEPPPYPPEESRVPPNTPMAFFEDVDTESEEDLMSNDDFEGRDRQLVLIVGAVVLALAVVATGWFVWSRLNSEPLPLPEPNQEQSETD